MFFDNIDSSLINLSLTFRIIFILLLIANLIDILIIDINAKIK